MKDSYATRLRREQLEKKVEAREYALTHSLKLRERYQSDYARNERTIEHQQAELERAQQDLRAFNGEAEPLPVVDFSTLVWAGT